MTGRKPRSISTPTSGTRVFPLKASRETPKAITARPIVMAETTASSRSRRRDTRI